MATTFLGWRPSTLAAACVPSSLAAVAQPYALGQPAVSTPVPAVRLASSGFKARTAPIFGHPAVDGTTKINNSISTVAAMAAEGATPSNLPMNSVRVQKVQGDKVEGIPPRGRPV
jgi:hypothetical protein